MFTILKLYQIKNFSTLYKTCDLHDFTRLVVIIQLYNMKLTNYLLISTMVQFLDLMKKNSCR